MSVKLYGARLCAAFLVACFSSVTFAQVSQVADRASLAGTDFIDWQAQTDGLSALTTNAWWITSPAEVTSNGGVSVTVSQALSPWSIIMQGTSTLWAFTSTWPESDYLYQTHSLGDTLNPVTFSGFDGVDVCGLGTHILPYEPSGFKALITATNNAAGIDSFRVLGNNDTPVFVGVSSDAPLSSVDISIESTQNGSTLNRAWFAINRVELTACDDQLPMMRCEGFTSPMDQYPVKSKKNRVFPLKMELFDAEGFALTDLDLIAPPVMDVMFTSSTGEAVDVTDDILSVGKASEGNQFIFKDGIWQFKLSSKDYSAAGTYMVTAVSGDESEYVIDPSCVTSFVR